MRICLVVFSMETSRTVAAPVFLEMRTLESSHVEGRFEITTRVVLAKREIDNGDRGKT